MKRTVKANTGYVWMIGITAEKILNVDDREHAEQIMADYAFNEPVGVLDQPGGVFFDTQIQDGLLDELIEKHGGKR